MTTIIPANHAQDADRLNWDALVAEGKAAAKSQWTLGDLAREVETSYGGGELERYAEEIGVEYDALRDYKWVAEAYEIAARTADLTFRHHRAVASRTDRLTWLSLAADGKWSVRQMLAEIEAAAEAEREEAERERLRKQLAEDNEDLLQLVAEGEMGLEDAVLQAMARQSKAEADAKALRERKQLHSTELARAVRLCSGFDSPLARQTVADLYDRELSTVPFLVTKDALLLAGQNLITLAEEWS